MAPSMKSLTLALLLLCFAVHGDAQTCNAVNAPWVYLQQGVINSVTPAEGQLGSIVTITGERLLGGGVNITRVRLATVEVERVVSFNDSLVVVVAGYRASAGAGSIVLESNTGAQIIQANAWTYLTPGAIASVTPNNGQGGTFVTIRGTRLLGNGASILRATLKGVDASIERQNDTYVVLRAARSGAGRGDVVLTSDTGIRVVATNAWTYNTPGFIAAAAPDSGVEGTKTIIFGNDLKGQGTRILSVTLAGQTARITEETDFFVRVIVPYGVPNTVGDIVITSDTGAIVALEDGWMFKTPGNITNIDPSNGITNTRVVITGTNLFSGGNSLLQVRLAGITANIISANNTHVVVDAGASETPGSSGDVELFVDTGPVVRLVNGWTYNIVPGDIFTVEPNSGQFGTRVVVQGVSLLAGGTRITSITLAGVEVFNITSYSDSVVEFIANGSPTARTGNIVFTVNTGATVRRLNGWTFVAPGQISAVQPSQGQMGTYVTITGTTLLAGAASIQTVTLAGVHVQRVISSNNTIVQVVAGAEGALSSGNVVLFAASGAVITRANSWTYVTPSAISSVSPNNGQGGTLVTITGSRLRGNSAAVVAASLNGVPAAIISESPTSVVIRAGDGAAGSGNVFLVAADGAQSTVTNGWTYNAPGVISSVSPNSGQLNTLVTITGTSLRGGGVSVDAVYLAEKLAIIVNESDTTVLVRAADEVAKTGNVTLVANTGATVRLVNGWTYRARGSISNVSPNFGQAGTRVTISGSSLRGSGSRVADVTLAGTAASIIDQTDTVVRVSAGAGSVGTGDVVLTADSGATVSLANGWTYNAPGDITFVSPTQGQHGTIVELRGTNLRGSGSNVVGVTLNGVPVKSILSENNTVVRVVADRSGAAGTGDIVLSINTGTTITKANAWTYLLEGVITSVQPADGQEGTKVTVNGNRLLGGGTVIVSATIAGAPVSSIESSSDSRAVLVAAHNSPQTGDIVLVADTGAIVSRTNAFTYIARGVVSSITPARGQLGTIATILGSGLFGGGSSIVRVDLKGVSVFQIVSQNDSYVVVRAGESASTGAGAVVVTSNTGAVSTLNNGWTYETASDITTVQPASGQVGTLVTISGTNLLGVSGGSTIVRVLLAGVQATVVTSSSTEVIVTAPRNGSLAVGDVITEADNGARTVKTNGFTFLLEGVIASVSPAFGQLNTLVTISGQRLLGGGASVSNVTLAGIMATVVSTSNTQIVVRASAAGTEVGSVVVVSNTGAIVQSQSNSAFEYRTQGSIASVAPSTGQFGTVVTISGTSLRGHGSAVTSVTLAGVTASISSELDNRVVVVAADSAARQGHVVLTANTGATVTLENGWTYAALGAIADVSPSSGQFGTRVTITGSSLRASGASVASVRLVNVLATITSENDTHVIVAAGNGPNVETTGNVVLTANTGAVITRSSAFTYLIPGQIFSVRPNSGRVGTYFTVVGNLCGGGSRVESIQLVGLEASLEEPNDCGIMTARANDFGANVTGDVVVISDTGAKVTRVNAWTYISEGLITSVTPAAGQAGSSVTIQGRGLFGGGTGISSVTLAGVSAFVSPTGNTDTRVVVTALAGTTSGDVIVTGNTGVVTRYVNGWTYSVIQSVSPSSGQRGTIVTISGRALLAGGASISSVRFSGILASSIVSANATTVVAVATAFRVSNDIVGAVEMVVNNGQTVSLADAFTYKPPGSMNVVTPSSGQLGTIVSITGTNLLGYGSALVGASLAGVPVLRIVGANETSVVLEAAASTARFGDVVLTSDTGSTVVLADGAAQQSLPDGRWTYVTPQVVTSVTPSIGQLNTIVTIGGTNLLGGGSVISQVTLAGVPVSSISSSSATRVVVVAAGSPATAVSDVILVANTGARVTAAASWQYATPGDITNVSPASGQEGTRVTLTGSNLRGSGTSVQSATISGVPATILNETNTFVVLAAGRAAAGSGDIVLVSSSGATITETNGFEYLVAGVVSSVSPSSGQLGTRVTITGTNLLGGGSSLSLVFLGSASVAGASIISESNTQVVVAAGDSITGSTGVTLVADTGATVVNGSLYQALALGLISTVSPSSGQSGTRVTISGQRLLGGGSSVASVTFGPIATAVQSATNTQVVVISGPGGVTGQSVDVVILADTGARVTKVNGWTPSSFGAIQAVAPSSGQVGTRVTITGTSLLGGGASIQNATLAGVPVRSVSSSSDSSAVVVADVGAPGTGDVVLVANTGAIITRVNAWTYLAQGNISTVVPYSGQEGTLVTITGERLFGGGSTLVSASLAGVAGSIVSMTNTNVVVRAAASVARVGDVVLVADTGAIVSEVNGFTYLQPSVIQSVTPANGIDGTLVTIVGQRLLGGGSSIAEVTLVGRAVSSIVSGNDTVVIVRAGEGGATAVGSTVVAANTGALSVAPNTWQYQAPGVITTVTPAFGQVGTRVTIVGTKLLGDGTSLVDATLAGVSAIIRSASASTVVLEAASNPLPRSGSIVLTSNTGGRVSRANAWEYRAEGLIANVIPNSGQEGTRLYIVGQSIRGHGTTLVSVTLAGVPATIVRHTDFFVEAIAAAGPSAGVTGDVVLTSDTGSRTTAVNGFTYVASANITSVEPAFGIKGVVVTITGVNLRNGGASVSRVFLAGIEAEIRTESDSSVVVVARDGPAAVGDVLLVSDTEARVRAANAFEYLQRGDIHTVDPSRGQYGTIVTITGTSLLAGSTNLSSISLAGVEILRALSVSSTQLVVVADASPARVGDIVLRGSTGAVVTRVSGWTYVAPAVITALTPSTGQLGTRVTVTGTTLLAGGRDIASAFLGGYAAARIISSNNTHVIFEADANDGTAGTVDLQLVGGSGAIISKPNAWAYLQQSDITNVSPASGQGGTLVTITGVRLHGGGFSITRATLNGLEAQILSQSNTRVVVAAAASANAGTGHVVLESDSGARTVELSAWTYNPAGSIQSISPNRGQLNTFVTITGTSLLGGGSSLASASLANVSATIVSANDSVVLLRASASTARTGDVVLVADSGAIVQRVNGWVYIPPAQIVTVTPNLGQGGTLVTIQGTGLFAGGSAVTRVLLANEAAVEISSASETRVVVKARATISGKVGDVVLEIDSGATVTLANGFTYAAPGLISSVSPASGQVGSRITLSGSNLLGQGASLQSVTLAGVAVSSIISQTNTAVVVVASASVPGVGDVVLTANTGAEVSLTNGFEYLQEGVISSVTPNRGQGGTRVVIGGTRLLGGGASVANVTLVGVQALSIDSASNNSFVSVLAGASAPGLGGVVIIANTGAVVSLADAFTYQVAGAISSITPNHGQLGTRVSIVGTNLLGGGSTITSVTLAGVEALSISTSNNTHVTARAGASVARTGDVVLTSDTGALVTRSNAWTYDTQSVLATVTPSQGQVGTLVMLEGSSFFGLGGISDITSVTLAGVTALVNYASDTRINVTAQSASAIVGDVVVVAASGAITTKVNGWTYLTPSVINSVQPNQGRLGTVVTITGQRLRGGGASVVSVTLVNVAATIVSESNTQIVVNAGDETNKVGDVVVTANTGATTTLANGFTYGNASSISSVSPSNGQGGTRVTISGVALRGYGTRVTQVTLAGVVASIQSDTDSQVVVVAGTSAGLTGDVVVTGDTGAVTVATNAWTYNPSGVIQTVSPSSGQVGTKVTISGQYLRGSGANVVNVTLVNRLATIDSENDTVVIASAAEGPASDQTGNVVLVSNTGAIVTRVNAFTYKTPGVIAVVDPSSGQGGSSVSITGTNLCGSGARVASVILASLEADIQSQVGCSLVRVVTRDYGANRTGDVVLISNTGARVTLENGWSYLASGYVSSVVPNAGQAGDLVTITGIDLFGGAARASTVLLAGVPATIVRNGNTTSITVRANSGPNPGEPNLGDIVITGESGVIIRAVNAWTHSEIKTVTPSFGQQGTIVTISGAALLAGGSGASSVRLVGETATTILSASSTTVVVAAREKIVVSDQPGTIQIVSNNGQTVSSSGNAFTYKVPGDITSVSPNRGQVGSVVTINGVRLRGHGANVVNVTLNGSPVQRIVSESDSRVIVVAGSASAGAGNVVLTADSGAQVIKTNGFTYSAEGQINTVSPSSGQEGTRVTIRGTNLNAGAILIQDVLFANVSVASIVSQNDTVVVVVASHSAPVASGDVVLVSVDSARVTKPGAWEYLLLGDITSVVPNRGQINTRVTIGGQRLRGGGASVASVSLAGVAASSISSESDAQVIAVASRGSPGVGDVILTSSSGAVITEASAWTYLTEGDILSVVPGAGHFGTRVVLQGTNLLAGATNVTDVTLKGVSVTRIVRFNNTHVEVVAADGGAIGGLGAVVITVDSGATVTKTNGFTYVNRGVISSVSPNSGQVGTYVTLSGTGLLGGGSAIVFATIGGEEASVVSGNSATQIRLRAGDNVAGIHDILIQADTGATVTTTGAFQYLTASAISSVNPNSGNLNTVVTVSGARLLGGGSSIVRVTLAGVDAKSISSFSQTVVVAVADASAATSGDVVLEADTGALTTLANAWTYVTAGSISSVSPASGQVGTLVTISGTGLYSGASAVVNVTLAGTEATIVSHSNSVVKVSARSSTARVGDVVLIADSGALVRRVNGFEYLQESVVSDVSPRQGIHGTVVTITGQRLLGGGSRIVEVSLAGILAEQIISSNNSHVILTAGPSSATSLGAVILTADTGAISTFANGFQYQTPGVITQVSPLFGQIGTRVQIQGTRLLGDGTRAVRVTLAGVDATITDASNTVANVVAAGSSARSGDVVVISETGGRVTALGSWEYRTEGNIIAVSPSNGHEGTEIIIFGLALRGHGSNVISVSLAGVLARLVDESDSFVRVVANAGSPGTGNTVLTSSSGAVVTRVNSFTYLAQGVITSVSPSAGELGTVVEIRGTNLLGGGTSIRSISLVNVSPVSVLFFNNTFIRITAPRGPGIAVTGDIVITSNTGATVTKVNGWSFILPGDIDAIIPGRGQGNSVVTIRGASLLGGGSNLVSVTLASEPVKAILNESESEIVVVASYFAGAKTGDVVLVSDTGAIVTQLRGWTYAAPAAITTVSPTSGQVGTLVTISGTSLRNGGSSVARALLNGVPATIVSQSESQVIVSAASGSAGVGNITLFSDSAADVTKVNAWTYLEAGVINSITPSTGHGGTIVTIAGLRLYGGGSSITAVKFSGVNAVITSHTDTEVVVRAQPGTQGTGDVVLTANTGAFVNSSNAWTYVQPGVVVSATPNRGQLNTRVTILGTNLLGGGSSATRVSLDGVTAGSISSSNSTTVVVVAGSSSGALGVGVIEIESNTGAIVRSTAGRFSYVSEGTISSVTPNNGQEGTRVTIAGTSLLAAGSSVATVTLKGAAASIISSSDSTVIVAAGASTAGAGNVQLVADTGATVTALNAFTYNAPGTIAGVSPNTGQIGTLVTISGTNLRGSGSGVTSVQLAGVAVAQIVSETNTQVVVKAAAGTAGQGDVVLTANTGALVRAVNGWTYLQQSVITSVVPSRGQQGTRVTIVGSRLLGGGSTILQATLAGVSVDAIMGSNNTHVVLVAGVGNVTVGDVVLVSDTGATTTRVNGFEYLFAGRIDLVSPSQGQLGTFVSIYGVNLLGGGSSVRAVRLGGVSVLNVVSATNDIVKVRAARSVVLGVGDIEIESNTGSIVELVSGWTYDTPSNITSVCV